MRAASALLDIGALRAPAGEPPAVPGFGHEGGDYEDRIAVRLR
jgi:hypothetical protein